MNSEALLQTLPDTLEYAGEFGTELICFVPFVRWLHVHGHLRHRRVITYAGMRPFYYFLDDANYSEKPGVRHYVPRNHRPTYLPNRGELTAEKSPFEMFPDYRSTYGGQFQHTFKKPVLIIHNKHCDEWELGPINFITIASLRQLFASLRNNFQIVYFREGFGSIDATKLGFSPDHNHPLAFDDESLLENYPEVISFERLALANADRLSYNELKLRVFADCHCFISSQGGGNFLPAILGGGTLVILHRAGYELRRVYAQGFYRYAAEPRLRLLIARTSAQLEDAARVFHCGEDHTGPDPELSPLVEKYAPDRWLDPNHVPARPMVW